MVQVDAAESTGMKRWSQPVKPTLVSSIAAVQIGWYNMNRATMGWEEHGCPFEREIESATLILADIALQAGTLSRP